MPGDSLIAAVLQISPPFFDLLPSDLCPFPVQHKTKCTGRDASVVDCQVQTVQGRSQRLGAEGGAEAELIGQAGGRKWLY